MQYEELDLHSHTLKRPDTYVGSIVSDTTTEYVFEDQKIVKKSIQHIPALMRIFIEALSNAIDNVIRSRQYNVPCKTIKVSVDPNTGETSVWNDGLSIPIQIHEQSGIYIPDMLFGRLLTSSNYNDDEKRETSGRNGLGISLTNIFSSKFSVDIVNADSGKAYHQTWENNMKVRSEPKITSSKLKRGYTKVTWTPDFAYFKVDGYSDEFISLLTRYVYDAAMIVSSDRVQMYLNDQKLPVRHFKDYVKLYIDSDVAMCALARDHTQCIVAMSDCGYSEVSFVNGMYTSEGGVHVDAWTDPIFKYITQKVASKLKYPKLTVKDVKPYFKVFVLATTPNPVFSTQSKTKLVSPRHPIPVDPKEVQSIMNWSFVQDLKATIEAKDRVSLKKVETKRTKRIDGYDPANKAGSRDSHKCTLILCEGLSAKTYAVMGIDQGIRVDQYTLKGRDWFGIMPLKGVLMNVRNYTSSAISENKEIVNMIQALGLQSGVDYSDNSAFKKLKYGRVLILTDADCDGIHIQGLILNMFHWLFPSLFTREGFLTCMHTPIMKVTYRRSVERFYSLDDAHSYLQTHQPAQIKYYKGLGTSTDEDVRATFGKHIVAYRADEQTNTTMSHLFGKQHAQYRKQWLASYEPTTHNALSEVVDTSAFLNHELIKFSIEDCKRSIPHIMDGFKESQRKIVYACFKKKLTTPIKVAQLAGYVAEHTNYHHGEVCLFDTIIKMAQDFIGSNNIPLLQKEGQFGTRMQPNGSDAANARYIFTTLPPLTRILFDPSDDGILTHQFDDGDPIEPVYYAPIIPMVLVNGANGIATGWSTNIPLFNPADLVTWIKCHLSGNPTPELIPWYKGFKGRIEKESDIKYNTYGVYEVKGDELYITEIPIGSWVDKYKEYLEELVDKKVFKQMKNYSTPDCVHFVVTTFRDQPFDEGVLKLKSTLSLGNMVLFNTESKIQKYNSVNDIMIEFCSQRLTMYDDRKASIVALLENTIHVLTNKIKCIQLYVSNRIDLRRDCVAQFESHGIMPHEGGFEYLLNLPVRTFTQTRLDELVATRTNTLTRLETIKRTTPCEMWMSDLTNLRSTLI